MSKKTLAVIGIFIAVLSLLAITSLYRHKNETSVASNPIVSTNTATQNDGTWSDSARYAFITDKKNPQMAVFDTYQKKIISVFPLKAPSDYFSISRLGGFIVYAKNHSNAIYRLDLQTRQQEKIALDYPIEGELIAHSEGRWLTYLSDNKVVLMNLHKGKVFTYATSGKVDLLYTPTGESLLITELEQGKLLRVNLETQQKQLLLDLHKPISPISVMPNMMALFFSVDNDLVRYSLLDSSLNYYPMSPSAERPYITSESRTVLRLVGDKTSVNGAERLQVINAYTRKKTHEYTLPNLLNLNDEMVTGWLDQIAILAAQKGLYSIDLSSHETKLTALHLPVISMLIQPDSKTLLAVQQNSPELLLFDVKNQQVMEKVDAQLESPERVYMGQTTTLCH